MSEPNNIIDGELLYDPMFDGKVVTDWTDSEKGGFFGKAIFKKTAFILVLIIAIAGSLFFSFSSLSKDRFEFDEADGNGYKLSAFHGQKTDTVLSIDFVRDDSNTPDTSKPVTQVRKFTSTGNDTLQFIFIGKDVSEIERTAFFYCTALNAVYVDEANQNYTSIDGILYKEENGVPTEAVFCPQQHTKYMIALSLGDKVPANTDEAEALAQKLLNEDYTATLERVIEDENSTVGKTIIIPETVTRIDQLCFAYCDAVTAFKLPAGLKEIETMAFFKCSGMKSLELPDGIETIGSDAFSKCSELDYLFIPASIKSIGHHAFWDCGKIEKVYMASQSLDGIELGNNWAPQYRKTFMKDREIVFGAERGVK